ncbi:hypothetical protein HY797_01035 [Candidatus Falkowbacteria bacterium]|nr:hypothetical protein [Candidatus Falkowbacteria bacterium]
MLKEQEFYTKNPAEKWKLPEERSSVEIVGDLNEALKSKNFNQIQEMLKDPQITREVLLDRREESNNLAVLRECFDSMLKERFRERFFKILTIISENEERLKDKTVFIIALHNLATWESSTNKNSENALEVNKGILNRAIDAQDKILETKIRYGIAHNKILKPKDKVNDFEGFIKSFNEFGNKYDAIQAMNEASKSYLSLAQGQWGNSRELKFENLAKAKKMAEEALEKAEKLNYSNAMYKANLVLADIYSEMKDKVRSGKYQKEAERLKKMIGYKY